MCVDFTHFTCKFLDGKHHFHEFWGWWNLHISKENFMGEKQQISWTSLMLWFYIFHPRISKVKESKFREFQKWWNLRISLANFTSERKQISRNLGGGEIRRFQQEDFKFLDELPMIGLTYEMAYSMRPGWPISVEAVTTHSTMSSSCHMRVIWGLYIQ